MAMRWAVLATSCTPSVERCARVAARTRPPRHTTFSSCRGEEGPNDFHHPPTNHGGTENTEFEKYLRVLRVFVARVHCRVVRRYCNDCPRPEPDAPALGQGRSVPRARSRALWRSGR